MYPHTSDPSSGSFVFQQAEELKRQGNHVDVLHIHGYRSKFNYFKGSLDVFLRTLRFKYDVVHAHYGLTGLPSLCRYRTPLVISLHGSDALVGKIQPFISRFVSSFASAVIVVSKQIASIIDGVIIPCGVDLDVYKPYNRNEARVRLGLPINRWLVLFPFDPRRKIKRYDLATSVINKMKFQGYDIELLVVFGVKNDEMPWYYSAADAMILCSDSEGSPTSVKEALACNTPVVATDIGDVQEIMEGIPGAVCEKNVDALAKCLEQILVKGKRHEFDGRSFMQRYDQRTTIQSILAVYNSVICRQNGRPQI